jgi:hypothetical protein
MEQGLDATPQSILSQIPGGAVRVLVDRQRGEEVFPCRQAVDDRHVLEDILRFADDDKILAAHPAGQPEFEVSATG